MALEEAKAKYTRYEVDLWNKPEWFVAKVNPVGKVSQNNFCFLMC
jgi:glutathione S-transferase